MYFLLLVLHDLTRCDDVLKAWEQAGVSGVTILPSTGLARLQKRALHEDIPLIPSLEDFFTPSEDGNRTLFTILQDDSLIPAIVAATEGIIGKLDEPETGIIVVLPVYQSFGLVKNTGR